MAVELPAEREQHRRRAGEQRCQNQMTREAGNSVATLIANMVPYVQTNPNMLTDG